MVEAFQYGERVRRDHDRRAHFVELFEKTHELIADLVVEIARRFIGEKQFRLNNYGARNGDALLLAAGKGFGQTVHAIAKADPFEKLGDMGLYFLFALAADPHRQGDIVKSGKMIEQAEILKDNTDFLAQRHQCLAAETSRIFAEHGNQTARAFTPQIKKAHQRGLAGTARAAQKME